MPNNRRKCSECGKPLGSTYEKCFEHGGKPRRAGQPIGPHKWQLMLGVPRDKLKEIDYAGRDYDLNDRGKIRGVDYHEDAFDDEEEAEVEGEEDEG